MSASISLPAPADTIDIYFINGKQVERFDGSQLVGCTIRAWTSIVVGSGKHYIRNHNIIAERKEIETLYFLNNKNITWEEYVALDKDSISSIKVYKYKSPDNPDRTVVSITTKKPIVELQEDLSGK